MHTYGMSGDTRGLEAEVVQQTVTCDRAETWVQLGLPRPVFVCSLSWIHLHTQLTLIEHPLSVRCHCAQPRGRWNEEDEALPLTGLPTPWHSSVSSSLRWKCLMLCSKTHCIVPVAIQLHWPRPGPLDKAQSNRKPSTTLLKAVLTYNHHLSST